MTKYTMMAGLSKILIVFGRIICGGGENNIKTEPDVEWIQLVLEAKNLGIEKEEIQSFLLELNSEKNLLSKNSDFT